MKKVLIVSTVSRQFYLFEQTNIKVLRSNGFEVHGAANYSDRNSRLKEVNIIEHQIDFDRNPFSLKNIKAYKQLKELLNKENFDLVHCHSPVGGVLARIACRNKTSLKVAYTAHGFHFFKGAPILNWLIFFPIEKALSKYTDLLITINLEDYNLAKKYFKMKHLSLVNGVGVNFKKFSPVSQAEKNEKRRCYNYSQDSIIFIYVAELSKRKNQYVLVKAIEKLVQEYSDIMLLLVGSGSDKLILEKYIKQSGVARFVKLLGYRNDVSSLMQISDVALSSSKQEGLPVNLIEAMASGLPILASNCRGNRDLVINYDNGLIVEDDNPDSWYNVMKLLIEDSNLRKSMGNLSVKLSSDYSNLKIESTMTTEYQKLLREDK